MVRLRDAPSAVPGTLTRYQVCSLELVVQPLRHLDLLLVRLGRHELPGSLRGLDLGMQPLGGQRTNDLQYVRNESVRVRKACPQGTVPYQMYTYAEEEWP